MINVQFYSKYSRISLFYDIGNLSLVDLLVHWVVVLERVQLFGLVDSPSLDSRVPVDSRVQQGVF